MEKKMLRNKLLLLLFLIVGGVALVLASVPIWVGYNVNYTAAEGVNYYHNLSANITGFNNDVTFAFDTQTDINWTNSSGTYPVTPDDISSWINIYNENTGNLTINATDDSQSGFFKIPIQANNGSDASVVSFKFIVNATNDAPVFSLNSNYSVAVPRDTNTTKNITLVGSDEEGHYPLSYNVSFNNCSFASWSSRTNADCSLPYTMFELSNTTSDLAFYNLSHNDVGEYNLTICATDNVSGSMLPLYRTSDYNENKTTCYNTTLYLFASLFINATDCNNTVWQEGETLSCWINISTVGATDLVDVNSDGSFTNDGGSVHNSSWFYADGALSAVANLIAINVTVPNLGKEEVGNWTMTFGADDGVLVGEPPRPVEVDFSIFVNYTESPVGLSTISNVSELYENDTFDVTVTDNDLLIWDNSVKKETFTFDINESWVSVTNEGTINSGDSSVNYRTADVLIDHSFALSTYGVGNYSVQFNVTDGGGNIDTEYFVVEILNDTAPEWDGSLSNPELLQLTEDDSFYYNLSRNVTDVDAGDTISFYFEDLSGDFCNLNSTNFLSMGNISFTPLDCDVGYHNVTITASDGKINSSHIFAFNISNVHDTPVISSPSDENATEGVSKILTIQVDDDDYLIPSTQLDFYNESLTINITIENITSVASPISFSFSSTGTLDETEFFQASFTAEEENVGVYNISVNITDSTGLYDFDYFELNITQVNDAPNLSYIPNQETTSLRVFYLDVNATDEEDSPNLPESGLLGYTLENLTVGGDFLTINSTTGIINVTMSESLVGTYTYNLTVNDSDGGIDFQEFNLTVYGAPNITLPGNGTIFNFTENEEVNISFNVSYAIANTNLSYAFYLDRIVFSNSTNYNYSNLTLRNVSSEIWSASSNFTSNFTLDYSDETYGMLKNLTLVVYNTEYPELNDSLNYKLNVTHKNSNITFSGYISDQGPITVGSIVDLNLSDYFTDVDYFDSYYSQNVNFSITTVSGTTYVQSGSSFNGWTLNLRSVTPTVEIIRVDANEYDNGTLIGNASSNDFEVEFIPPTVIEEETEGNSGSGSTTQLKHFSLKLIMPQDVILSDNNYIDVPFSVQNTGSVTLNGINLDSSVRFNNMFSDDVKVTLQDTYIPTLAVGQVENYTLRLEANTQKSGKYKVTVMGNVTSPKFSDWGEFFITLQKTNESEAEQILLFTEQFLADNPECIELTEILNRAFGSFSNGELEVAVSLAEEATIACEEAITANEQIRYSAKSFVERNFYLISFIFIGLFVGGLVFYIYKRVRFNKYKGDYY